MPEDVKWPPMEVNASDDSYLLQVFLFCLRTPLAGIQGASHLARQMSDRVPVRVLNWLEKWRLDVEGWIVAEEKAHLFLQDGQAHDWKQIIYEMAANMKSISIAYNEGLTLDIPESPEGKMIFELALNGGFEYLNTLIQPILSRDYNHLMK